MGNLPETSLALLGPLLALWLCACFEGPDASLSVHHEIDFVSAGCAKVMHGVAQVAIVVVRSQFLHCECFKRSSANFFGRVERTTWPYGTKHTGIEQEELRVLHKPAFGAFYKGRNTYG